MTEDEIAVRGVVSKAFPALVGLMFSVCAYFVVQLVDEVASIREEMIEARELAIIRGFDAERSRIDLANSIAAIRSESARTQATISELRTDVKRLAERTEFFRPDPKPEKK